MRVARDEEGVARGTIPMVVRWGYSTEIIAQPGGWEEDRAIERAFEEAEKVRLLYVAATRARDELWIGSARGLPRRVKASPWAVLEDWVTGEAAREAGGAGQEVGGAACERGGGIARVVELPREDAPEADVLDAGTDMGGSLEAMEAAAERSRGATYRLETVTGRAKGEGGTGDDVPADSDPAVRTEDFAEPGLRPASGGFEWGSVVHEVLAAAGEGMDGEPLAQLARDLLIEFERPVDRTGAPTEMEALLELVAAVRASSIWRRAMASGERHSEVPFALNPAGETGGREVLEGVIDLVFRENGHWVVADYKTDSGEDPEFEERVGRYRAQVDLYADCWERLTGEVVGERALVFTAQGRVERW